MASASLSVLVHRAYIRLMSVEDTGSLIYLTLLGLFLGGSYFVASRTNWARSLQQAAIWALIFLGTIAAIGMWGDIRRTVAPQQSVVSTGQISVPRFGDGHYYLTVEVNNIPLTFVVDTGASQVVLTQEDAARVGLDPENLNYLGIASTANGTVRTASITLDSVGIGPIKDRNVRAVVNGGEMAQSLLGMSYLGAFESIEIRNNELILTR